LKSDQWPISVMAIGSLNQPLKGVKVGVKCPKVSIKICDIKSWECFEFSVYTFRVSDGLSAA
jgi:hypothetical protein